MRGPFTWAMMTWPTSMFTSVKMRCAFKPTCRLCDRLDCEQRAYPPLQHALTVNEHVRGISFFAPLKP